MSGDCRHIIMELRWHGGSAIIFGNRRCQGATPSSASSGRRTRTPALPIDQSGRRHRDAGVEYVDCCVIVYVLSDFIWSGTQYIAWIFRGSTGPVIPKSRGTGWSGLFVIQLAGR